MITYKTGNLLDADVEALVNTVNTVGVMGKGVALMFKERFAKNMKEYAEACKAGEVQTGKMFITNTNELLGVTWIINFPTKQHWRNKSKMEWVESWLQDLRMFIIENNIKSIAIPPLGAGNGGLKWQEVKPKIVQALEDLEGVDIFIYEPTTQYQNIRKKVGVSKLTPARALVLELIRRYLIIGMDCSQVEVQKLVYILSRSIASKNLNDPFDLSFTANRYGPYANKLTHLLNNLDGYYLLSDKRITDVQAFESSIRFNYDHKQAVDEYLQTTNKGESYLPALKEVVQIIDGFESPYGMELLATVDWLVYKEGLEPTLKSIKKGLKDWFSESGETKWGQRKLNTFDDKSLNLAIERLAGFSY
jgi:O-acetyl-ADP-ribose deacetylase (regulator of RNase III)